MTVSSTSLPNPAIHCTEPFAEEGISHFKLEHALEGPILQPKCNLKLFFQGR